MGPMKPQINAKAVRLLGVMGESRPKDMPQIPTVRELSGLSNFNVSSWNALAAPAKTPKAQITKLNQMLNKVLEDKEIIKRIEGHGADVETSTPEQLGEWVRKDLAKWRQVVQKAKLQAD